MIDATAPAGPRRAAPLAHGRLLAGLIGVALLVAAPSLTAAEPPPGRHRHRLRAAGAHVA